jgi:hypothetical protein
MTSQKDSPSCEVQDLLNKEIEALVEEGGIIPDDQISDVLEWKGVDMKDEGNKKAWLEPILTTKSPPYYWNGDNTKSTDMAKYMFGDKQEYTRDHPSVFKEVYEDVVSGRGVPREFLSTLQPNTQSQVPSPAKPATRSGCDKPQLSQIMELTFQNTKRKVQYSSQGEAPSDQMNATGTVLSILQWSEQPHLNLDYEQQLSFQIITAAVVLTYYDDASGVDVTVYSQPNGTSRRSSMRHDFIIEKAKLRALTGLSNSHVISKEPLRMFLDGAGGSGKSHVVNEVLLYASQYAAKLNCTFDMRTIVVTAISGVAATSIASSSEQQSDNKVNS